MPEPENKPSRGPKRAYSKEKIAALAIRIADAEGLEAASIRRIAAKLGSGAASLYRYVANKQELFDLMADNVLGEDRSPDPAASGAPTCAKLRASIEPCTYDIPGCSLYPASAC